MEKKKLLVTASTFPRWENDTEPRFVLDLCTHMTDDFDVTVLAPAAVGAADKEVIEGVKVIRYHYFPIHKWETLCYPGAIVPRIKEKKIRALLVPFLLASLWLKLLLILPQFDVVHAHWLIPQGIVQSFFKKPYIVTGHGGDVASLNMGIIRRLKVRCLKRANRVTAVSVPLKEKMQELLPGLEPSVISMGVDTSKFSKQYHVPNYFGQGNKKVVLFVGRLAEKKGVRYLIDAMQDIDALLVIVGDGPLKTELMQQAKQINLQGKGEKIIFLGAKTHDELKTVYASADIFAAPSVTASDGDKEGLGLVILEAMASGLPIVASKSGGIIDIVKDNVNGLLCEEKCVWQLADSISALLDDPKLYETLVQNAIGTANSYDYSVSGRKYCALIGESC